MTKPTTYEEWTAEDARCAYDALVAHGVRTVDHPLVKPGAADVVWRNVTQRTVEAAFVDTGYLLVFDCGPAWCTDEDLFYELLLTRARPGGSFLGAVDGMRWLAKEYGCSGIMTGNGVSRPGLRRMYERAGFYKLNETYYKEV